MPYFDYNATAPLLPAAADAWHTAQTQYWQNPGSPYVSGTRVRLALSHARERLAELLGVENPQSIIFTSGATEGNNSLFAHLAKTNAASARVIISAIEHPSVSEPAKTYFSGRVDYLPVDSSGVVQLGALRALVCKETVLVSIMAANNETGVIQPWREAHQLCRGLGIAFHCDATQWLGKLPASGMGTCDYLTGCAHKFGGPKGVGFLKLSDQGSFRSFRGGAQEYDHRAGTENYPAIAAMLAALEWCEAWIQHGGAETQGIMHDAFVLKVKAAFPDASVHGDNANRLWNTVSIAMPGGHNTRWVALMDKADFSLSTGAACATGKTGPSAVLQAMGVSAEAANRTIRISAGWGTSAEDYERLYDALLSVRDFLLSDNAEANVITFE